jgi:hypothetical protein
MRVNGELWPCQRKYLTSFSRGNVMADNALHVCFSH